MSEPIKIIECPRDAWQGLPKTIPVEIKADYLHTLIAAGFRHIDAVSFVSPAAVPQMADSERVLEFLDPPDDVEIIGIVVNAKGAERAIATTAVHTLGFPYSISPEFLTRNQNQAPEDALDSLDVIGHAAFKAGLDVVVYVSMAFGNPYGDLWSHEELLAACDLLADMGITQISLADTVGLATADDVERLVALIVEAHQDIEIGVHLHARPDEVAAKIGAAYRAGVRRFDMALGGLGGCPFAQDALVGNVATEVALLELQRLGAVLPPLRGLENLVAANHQIEEQYGAMKQ